MPKATFCIGIAASGKTTWAHQQKGAIVLDSDQLRLELYGDETEQRDPHKVFDLMYKRGRKYLLENKDVIFCSTNLGMKYRIHAIHQLRNIPNITFHAVVFNTPIDICIENNKKRARQVPEWLFMKQIKQFQPPVVAEGWDSIEVINQYKVEEDDCPEVYWATISAKVRAFGSQHNAHHSLSLIDHCDKCSDIAWKYTESQNLIQAASIHDYGKAYTATYWPGEKNDGQLHYPNHAEVGAYLALNMGYSIEVAQLVAYHMLPYCDEKTQKVWHARLGDELWNNIMLLNECDKASH